MHETGHVEYVIEPRVCAKTWLLRAVFAGTYLAVGALLMALTATLRVSFPLSVGVFLLTVGCLFLLTWRYTRVEYEISLEQDQLTCARIFGKRTRVRMLSVNVRDLVLVASLEDDEAAERARRYPITKEYRAVSSPDAPEIWFAVWNTGKDAYSVFYLEATDALLRALRFQNPTAVALRRQGGR
jgi:hypothetical protein